MVDPKQVSAATTGVAMGEVIPFRAPARINALELSETLAPAFTWEALERQLTLLAVGAACKRMVPALVSATRKQAPFKSPEMVLREVLCIASTLMDETFHPDGEEGGMT